MSFDIDVGCYSHKGPRPDNEDWVAAALPPKHGESAGMVAAIADGVSVGGGGKEASQTSVLSIVSDFHGAPDTWETSVILDRLISAQNGWLADHNRRRRGTRHTGSDQPTLAMTTLTVLALRSQTWTVAHVGDTRAWLLRGDDCAQLTQDHAFTEEFQRSRLMRAIGLDDQIRIDFQQGDLRVGDTFVLTSDGVHGVLSRARLRSLALQASDAEAASRAIVEAAMQAGTQDNATALVLRVKQLLAGRFADTLTGLRDVPPLGPRKAGDTIDGYTIQSLLADTGLHRLYNATSRDDDTRVVLKALHESRAGDPQEREMLAHEGWLGQRLAQYAPPRGEASFVRTRPISGQTACYVVFDWLDGETVEAMQARGSAADIADVLDGALAVARGLARLHRNGVIHRDIKPGNLLRDTQRNWHVLDLGAALSGSDPKALRDLRAGTPSYMNPEQWGRDGAEPIAANEASDVYALGVTLYQWLTTKLPYGVVEPYQTGRFRRDPKAPSQLRPDVPVWLDNIVLKAVALDPRQRFETAEELVLALERGAARPLHAHVGTPLIARDPTALWKIGLGVSMMINALLIYWLLFLPR